MLGNKKVKTPNKMYAVYNRLTGVIGKKSPSKKKTKNRCKALQAHERLPKVYKIIEID